MSEDPTADILDLDAPSEEPERPPFQFKFAGDVYTCQHPEALDVRDIADLVAEANANPAVLLPVMLPADQLERLEASEAVFDLGMLRRVQDAWQAHYGLDVPKSSGSRKSSKPKRIR